MASGGLLGAQALLPTLLTLLALVAALALCVFRRKRQTEGTYRPSAEEKKQVAGRQPEKPALPWPLPKEERLI